MTPSRRTVLAVAVATLSAGCSVGDPDPARDPTDDSRSTATPAGDDAPGSEDQPGDCETATPRPVPDLSATNDASGAVTATVTVARADGGEDSGDDSAPLYEATLSLDPGETVEAYDVFPDRGTYRVTVALAGGTAGTATAGGETTTTEETTTTVEAEPTRYGLVEVRIGDASTVDVGWLHVVPPATPTPCP